MGQKNVTCNTKKSVSIFMILILGSILIIHIQLRSTIDSVKKHQQMYIAENILCDPVSNCSETTNELQSDLELLQKQYDGAKDQLTKTRDTMKELQRRITKQEEVIKHYEDSSVDDKSKRQSNDITNKYENKIIELESIIIKLNESIMIQKTDNTHPEVVRIIWILWFQGWDKAPMIPQIVLKSWKYFNDKDWKIIPLSHYNLPFYVDTYKYWRNFVYTKYSWAGFSDIIRIELLKKYGGVWVDSTVFCTKPLNEWLFDKTNNNGFFAFDHPRKSTQISSWFLTSLYQNRSYIMNMWYKYVHIYWQKHSHIDQYFWLHGIFDDLYDNNDIFKKHWNSVSKISADGPHTIKFAKSGLPGIPMNKKVIKVIDNEEIAMFKLDKSVKWNASGWAWKSNLGHLMQKYIKINDTQTFAISNNVHSRID